MQLGSISPYTPYLHFLSLTESAPFTLRTCPPLAPFSRGRATQTKTNINSNKACTFAHLDAVKSIPLIKHKGIPGTAIKVKDHPRSAVGLG